MCGISGFYNLNRQQVDHSVLHNMLRTQSHRGPDSSGIFYNNHIGLAHNRLSLLDLSDNGKQPFENEDYVLIYNGEVYNFLDLKKDLPNINYKSTSDTEVLFHYLIYHGIEKTLSKIQGMFAFAWYNKKQDKLYLVRDKIGIKPLFYGVDKNNCLWFSSELKAIHKVAEFDPDSIQMLFSSIGGIAEKSRHKTLWKNLFTLSPGHFVKVENSSIQKVQYFSINSYVNEKEYNRLNNLSIKDVTSEFETIFDKAVKQLLISDAPMGAFISGGIDSSLIASHASKHQSDLKLFTANILGKYSEFSDAQKVAKHLNRDLFHYDFEKSMGIRDLAHVTWHYESPITVHFNALPFSNVSQLAREHKVKAVLTGEGADELFLGYPRLLTRRYNKIIRTPYSMLDKIYSVIPTLKRYMNSSEGSTGLTQLFQLATQGFSRQLLREEGLEAYGFLKNKDQVEQYLSIQMINEGIVSLLWRNDRMGMMHSIESRFPFLDESVMAFALNLPTKFKIGRTKRFHNYKHPFLTDKHIVRKLGEKSLPESLYRKKKNGFPLYGTRDMRVENKFLHNGVFSNLFQLTNYQIDYMINNSKPYHIALIAMFEVWGKLFLEKREISEVDELNQKYLKII
ncbi:asparagine synthase (glutamine-hydrolyzing) [Hanstruepera neustonica]|uniref:asparagine synthase (glutamine-hydrolyzing) n=1 Tax=Hanstruepera neustonica TaxID=1445657 RepID=A0A2K1DVP6_9FLAO|nr:asparagine synthase (glutamine-hydrolyzing) [Hanstruepera neustonica]PNQ72083.1 asparagine synthase (glutamine-hydrolyzing) [Hanstruepera neustonica]